MKLHRTGHTHEAHLLLTRDHRKQVCATRTRLAAAVLAVRLSRRRGGLASLKWSGCFKALAAQVCGFTGVVADGRRVTRGFPLLASLTEHIASGVE
jgi:hypothetical protein